MHILLSVMVLSLVWAVKAGKWWLSALKELHCLLSWRWSDTFGSLKGMKTLSLLQTDIKTRSWSWICRIQIHNAEHPSKKIFNLDPLIEKESVSKRKLVQRCKMANMPYSCTGWKFPGKPLDKVWMLTKSFSAVKRISFVLILYLLSLGQQNCTRKRPSTY